LQFLVTFCLKACLKKVQEIFFFAESATGPQRWGRNQEVSSQRNGGVPLHVTMNSGFSLAECQVFENWLYVWPLLIVHISISRQLLKDLHPAFYLVYLHSGV